MASSSYLEIAHHIGRRLRGGEWAPGERLPSASQLMQEYGVTRWKINSALSILRSNGLVHGIQGMGIFAGSADTDRVGRLEAEVAALRKRMEVLEKVICSMGCVT